MSDLKAIYINMAVLGILTLSIISFIIGTQTDNTVGTDNKLLNNTLINESYGDLEQTLEGSKSEMKASSDNLEDVPPSESIGDLDVASTISTTRSAKGIIVGLWNTFTKFPELLGVPSIITKVLTSILLLLIIIGIWALWKGAITT